MLRSRAVSQLTRPAAALGVFAGVQTAIQFTPFFNAALNNGWPHVLQHALYLSTGFLFWWSILAVDTTPRRAALRTRLVALSLAIPVEAALGLALLLAGAPLYAHYASLPSPWGGPAALASQHRAGLLLWIGGDAFVAAAAYLLLARPSLLHAQGHFALVTVDQRPLEDERRPRGGSGLGDEHHSVETVLHRVNTASRLSAALDAGFDRIEVDVWYAKGAFVLSHDLPIGRWTVGRSSVEFSSTPALLIHRHGPVVRLPEVLEMEAPSLFIDLKGPWSDHALGDLSGLLHRFGRHLDLIASNHLPTMERVRAIDPHRPRIYGVGKRRLPWLIDQLARGRRAFGISVDASDADLSEGSIQRLHRDDIFVYAWNFRSRDRLLELARAGIDGAILDDVTWRIG